MKYNKIVKFILLTIVSPVFIYGQNNAYVADVSAPNQIKGMKLVWNDEFEVDGKPDSSIWKYEYGFVRNNELQWYQSDNAICNNGVLVIEGRREKIPNPNYVKGISNWAKSRKFAEYTSSSINTRSSKQFMFGRFEIRARINTSKGSWPAIWTLGVNGDWPSNGEIDILEYYLVNDVPTILANTAWGTDKKWVAKWNSKKITLAHFTQKDKDWVNKFHIWRMDWDKEKINLYVDNELINCTLLSKTVNANGINPFHQPHYILLNLALGSNGGDPSATTFPVKYEVDYVRVYQAINQ